jgi:hypothetical protein
MKAALYPRGHFARATIWQIAPARPLASSDGHKAAAAGACTMKHPSPDNHAAAGIDGAAMR